jgi:hypothetical protein
MQKNYDRLSWVDALKARQEPRTLANDAKRPEDEVAGDALQKSAELAFGTTHKDESSSQAISRASKDIQDGNAASRLASDAKALRQKLADRSIDPVAMGVSTKEQWESNDPAAVNEIATKAAGIYAKQLKGAWQTEAMKPHTYTGKFSPETSNAGRILSSTAMNEETRGRTNMVPANANSIFDPGRLDRLAAGDNAHDKNVAAAKKAAADKHASKHAEITEKANAAEKFANDETMMHGSQVLRSGGQDQDIPRYTAPRNQLSIMDDLGGGKLSPEDLKKRLSDIFAGRIADSREQTQKSNETRREAIQGKKEPDRSWETTAKPASTGDLQRKLMNLWMPEPPAK